MPVTQLAQFTVPAVGDDRWVLAPWSSINVPFPILVRATRTPEAPPQNSTFGFVGVYQVALGRLLMFDNQVLYADPTNGSTWGTWVPANQNILVNVPNSPARYDWGLMFAIHRWMQPATITLESVTSP